MNENVLNELLLAALRAEVTRLRELADAMELNDMPLEGAFLEIERVEKNLRKLRQAA